MQDNKTICVMLSTYNGATYLTYQLDSILSQENINVELLIRDDGSTDNTFDIINQYCLKYDNVQILKGDNVGFIRSFSLLVDYAIKNYDDVCFFAFADQDDIWYKDKLWNSYNWLVNQDDQIPNLYCCNSDIVDKDGLLCGYTFRDTGLRLRKGNILAYGILQGCSMVFNKEAMKLYVSNLPEETCHDRWMYYICNYLGCTYYEERPMFSYRVHPKNAIGQNRKLTGLGGHRIKSSFDYWTRKHERVDYKTVVEFNRKFGCLLDSKYKTMLELYLNYTSYFPYKVRVMISFDFGPRYHGLKNWISYYFHVLFNKF